MFLLSPPLPPYDTIRGSLTAVSSYQALTDGSQEPGFSRRTQSSLLPIPFSHFPHLTPLSQIFTSGDIPACSFRAADALTVASADVGLVHRSNPSKFRVSTILHIDGTARIRFRWWGPIIQDVMLSTES